MMFKAPHDIYVIQSTVIYIDNTRRILGMPSKLMKVRIPSSGDTPGGRLGDMRGFQVPSELGSSQSASRLAPYVMLLRISSNVLEPALSSLEKREKSLESLIEVFGFLCPFLNFFSAVLRRHLHRM